MSKYTKEKLKAKAIATLRYKTAAPDYYLETIMRISVATGIHPQTVVNKIEDYANA